MADDPHWAGHVAPTRVRVPGEEVWKIRQNHAFWSAELKFHGESYGWESMILRDAELALSQRFMLREQAVSWADEQRQLIERGFRADGAYEGQRTD